MLLQHFTTLRAALLLFAGDRGQVVESSAAVSVVATSRRSEGVAHATLPVVGVDSNALLMHAEWVTAITGQPTFVWQLLPFDVDTIRALWEAGYECVDHHSLMRRGNLLSVAGASLEARLVTTSQLAEDFRTVHRSRQTAADSEEWLTVFGRDEVLLHPRVRACVTYIGNRPAGAGMAVLDQGTAVVLRVVTDPRFGRRGAGGAVMQALLRHVGLAGGRLVLLHSTRPAHHMYRQLGFQDVGLLQMWRGPRP